MDNSGAQPGRAGTLARVTTIRLQPDALHHDGLRYGDVVARVERARDELLATLGVCESALGAGVLDTLAELRSSLWRGLDVLVADHRQLRGGVAAVADCFGELDRALFR